MANPEHVEILKASPEEIDKWYSKQPPHTGLDLTNADLREINLEGINLYRANLSGANLRGAKLARSFLMATYLQDADLRGAILEEANAVRADFTGAYLDGANLKKAYLANAEFSCATLIETDLREAIIANAKFNLANLRKAKLDGIVMSELGPEGWCIDGVSCSHFFIESSGRGNKKKRVPIRNYLAAGEFEDRFKSRPTIEFLFEQGMNALDPAILSVAIDQANLKKPKIGLRLLDISARGGISRAIIEIAEKVSKKSALLLVQACYQQKIGQMQKEIQGLQADKKSLLQIASRKTLLPAMGSRESFMSTAELAKLNEVDTDALRKRLDRYRAKHALDTNLYVESQDRGKNKPKYLYNVKNVASIVEELKSKQASAKRPTRKKKKI